MSDSEKIRGLLNLTGFPFQHHCAQILAALPGFQVSMELPFTYPPTIGQLLGTHGAIDILAVCRTPTDELACFVVECKRADDKIKNWVFITNAIQDPEWPLFTFADFSEEVPKLATTRALNFPELGYTCGNDYEYCVHGFEANAAFSNTNRDQSEKIYVPLRQVAHGTKAFEMHYPRIVEAVEYFRYNEYPIQMHIPVVLTTASIYIADFPRGKVKRGEVDAGDLTLSGPKKWITYEFPLPDFLGHEVVRENYSTPVRKRTIFVVNAEAMDEFFTKALHMTDREGIPTR